MEKQAADSLDILIIEDDEDDAYLLKRALNQVSRERGLAVEVSHSVNGLDAMGLVARRDLLSRLPQIIIVDLTCRS